MPLTTAAPRPIRDPSYPPTLFQLGQVRDDGLSDVLDLPHGSPPSATSNLGLIQAGPDSKSPVSLRIDAGTEGTNAHAPSFSSTERRLARFTPAPSISTDPVVRIDETQPSELESSDALFHDHAADLINRLAQWSNQLDQRESGLDRREQTMNRQFRFLRQNQGQWTG